MDENTWKDYPTTLVMNNHGMLEIPIDLSDVVLGGTSNSIEQIEEIIPNIRLSFNM